MIKDVEKLTDCNFLVFNESKIKIPKVRIDFVWPETYLESMQVKNFSFFSKGF